MYHYTVQQNNTYSYTVLSQDNLTKPQTESEWHNLLETTREVQGMFVDNFLFPILEIDTAMKHSS